MRRIVFIVVVSLIAAITVGATGVSAQEDVHILNGVVVQDEDGDPAPEGTKIVAKVKNGSGGDVTLDNTGSFEGLSVGSEEETYNVSFYIGDADGPEADRNPITLDPDPDQGYTDLELTFSEADFPEVDVDDDTGGDDGSSSGSGGGGGGGGGGGSGGGGGGTSSESGPPSTADVRSTLKLADPSTQTTNEMTDANQNTAGVQLELDNTDQVDMISFEDEAATGAVKTTEYADPSQQVRDEVAQSVSGSDAVEGSISTISVAKITPEKEVAEESKATVTFSVPADEVDNPEQVTVVKEDWVFEKQEETWVKLDTTLEEVGEDDVTVSAETDGFSMFAVTEVSTATAETSQSNNSEKTNDESPGFGVTTALLAVIVLAMWVRGR